MRSLFQFNCRSLLCGVAFAAILCGWWTDHMKQAAQSILLEGKLRQDRILRDAVRMAMMQGNVNYGTANRVVLLWRSPGDDCTVLPFEEFCVYVTVVDKEVRPGSRFKETGSAVQRLVEILGAPDPVT